MPKNLEWALGVTIISKKNITINKYIAKEPKLKKVIIYMNM